MNFRIKSLRPILLFGHYVFRKAIAISHGARSTPTTPCGKSRIAFARRITTGGGNRVAEAALDDVFIDDITFPAADGFSLGGHPVSAARGEAPCRPDQFGHRDPAQDLQGFAGYLARRGCAVLTYDYRGTGDTRQKAMVGYNQPNRWPASTPRCRTGPALDAAGRGGLDARALQDPAAELYRPFLRRPGAGPASQQHRGVPARSSSRRRPATGN